MTTSNRLTPSRDDSIFVDMRLGNNPRYYLTPPEDCKMRVPENFRKTVAYVGLYKQDSNQKQISSTQGTAFIVNLESERHPGI